jgi:hypothetical protein
MKREERQQISLESVELGRGGERRKEEGVRSYSRCETAARKLEDHNSRTTTAFEAYTLFVQGRQVFNLQYLHSKMYQWGPEWHIEQTHWMRVDSDLSRLNEWWQYPGTAIWR